MANVTLQHEAPVSMLRETPAALLELLAPVGQEVAEGSAIAVLDSELTEPAPLAQRADLVALPRAALKPRERRQQGYLWARKRLITGAHWGKYAR